MLSKPFPLLSFFLVLSLALLTLSASVGTAATEPAPNLGNRRSNQTGKRSGDLTKPDALAAASTLFSFSEPQRISLGIVPRSVGFMGPSVDLNKDGHIDLLVAVNGGLTVCYGLGNGTFFHTQFYPVAEGEIVGVSTADLDNDQRLDVMIACAAQNKVAILYNGGPGFTLGAPVFLPVGQRPFGVDAVDLNEDGWLDLVATNHADHGFCTMLNKKDGTFAAPTFYSAGTYTAQPLHGDFNRDGHQDVVIPNYEPGNFNLYFGDGAGGFTSSYGLRLGSYVPQMIAADFNRDGILDLVASNIFSNYVTVLLGDGDGQFSRRVNYPTRQYPHIIRAADLDGDGALDLAVPHSHTNYFSAIRNDGKGALEAPQVFTMAGNDARFIAVGDFNEDGRVDVVTPDIADSAVTIRFNQTGVPQLVAPTGLTARVYQPRQVELRWTDSNSIEVGYKVYRLAGGEASYQEVATLGRNATLYREGPLPTNTYRYYVRAFTANRLSPVSAQGIVSVPDPPAAPGNFTATASPTDPRVDLVWTASAGNAEQYEVWRKTGAGAGGAFARRAVLPSTSRAYQETSLAPNTAYSYYVRAVNSTASADSVTRVITSSGVPLPATGLTATAAAGQRRITLAWQDPGTRELAYEVWRSENGAAYALRETLPANRVAFVDTTVAAGSRYQYFAVARNGWGASAPSNVATAITDAPPTAPRSLTAQTASLALRVNLAWQDPANETGVEVWRKPGPSTSASPYTRRATLAADTKTYTDTQGLAVGAEYSYYVVAVNALGSSPPSNTTTVRLDAAPTAPQALTVSPVRGKRRLRLQWQDAAGETSYEVWRKPGSQGQPGTYTRLNSLPAGTTLYVDTQVQWGKRYSYYLTAVNPLGSSESNRNHARVSKKR